jgi:ribosomal protein L24
MPTTSDFSVGDKVMFGRGRGEKTLGEVVKVNRKSLRVRQLEARGTHRSYPVGSVWTVGPTYCTKVNGSASAPAPQTPSRRPQTPREILAAKGIQTGDIVEFTFRRGDGTLQGRIARINAKRVTIEDVNSPKYPRGVYCNPTSIIRKIGTPVASAKQTPKLSLKVGQAVSFRGYSFNARGETTLQGVITKTAPSKGSYEVYGEGRFHTLTEAQVTATARRDDATIVSQVGNVYASLSPENLTCDGEASRSHVRAQAARLNRALKALNREAGRTITESETWEAYRQASK